MLLVIVDVSVWYVELIGVGLFGSGIGFLVCSEVFNIGDVIFFYIDGLIEWFGWLFEVSIVEFVDLVVSIVSGSGGFVFDVLVWFID